MVQAGRHADHAGPFVPRGFINEAMQSLCGYQSVTMKFEIRGKSRLLEQGIRVHTALPQNTQVRCKIAGPD